MITLILVFLGLITLFNQPILKGFNEQWAGFDRWLAVLPMALLALYYWVKSDYLLYSRAIRERDVAVAQIAALESARNQLARLVVEGEQHVENIYNGLGEVTDKEAVFNNDWVPKVRAFLAKEIPEKAASFEGEYGSGMGGPKDKMKFKVKQLIQIRDWLDATSIHSIRWNLTL